MNCTTYFNMEFQFGDSTAMRQVIFKLRDYTTEAIANVLYYDDSGILVFQRKIIYEEGKLKLHDTEGPAVIDHRINKADFFWYGKPVTVERFCSLANLSEKKQTLLKLKYLT